MKKIAPIILIVFVAFALTGACNLGKDKTDPVVLTAQPDKVISGGQAWLNVDINDDSEVFHLVFSAENGTVSGGNEHFMYGKSKTFTYTADPNMGQETRKDIVSVKVTDSGGSPVGEATCTVEVLPAN